MAKYAIVVARYKEDIRWMSGSLTNTKTTNKLSDRNH